MMTEEDTHAGGKQRLCQKYGITDQKLDFSYVNTCQDSRTLEKILAILRSKEEGSYSELEQATEERLKKLCANSHMLVKEQVVRKWNQLPKEEQEELSQVFLDWPQVSDARSGDSAVKETEQFKEYPAIRNSEKMLIEKSSFKQKPLKSCAPRSLESWDQYDVEKELSLIDREDELKHNERIRASNQSKTDTNVPEKQIQKREIGAGDAFSREKAIEEKMKGNEFYGANDHKMALYHYNRSLEMAPLPEVYNNRALVYLRMSNFLLALADCDKVLQMNEKDVKAHYRRSKALMGLNRLSEANDAIQRALSIDPDDKEVRDLANKIGEQLNLHPYTKKFRLGIQDVEKQSNPYIEEISSRDNIYYPFARPADNISLNDIGTARFMCRCNGSPPFIAKLRSVEDPPHTHRLYLRKTPKRSKKGSNEKSLSNRCSKKVTGAVNGEIIEKDTIEAGEKAVCQNESSSTSTCQSNLVNCLNTKDLVSIAKEMSMLSPSQLSKALSDRLDSTTLNLCVKALCNHLDPTLESTSRWKRIQEYLVALSHLPQFKSVVKFLDKGSIKVLGATIAMAEKEGQRFSHVLMLYELSGAKPPPS